MRERRKKVDAVAKVAEAFTSLQKEVKPPKSVSKLFFVVAELNKTFYEISVAMSFCSYLFFGAFYTGWCVYKECQGITASECNLIHFLFCLFLYLTMSSLLVLLTADVRTASLGKNSSKDVQKKLQGRTPPWCKWQTIPEQWYWWCPGCGIRLKWTLSPDLFGPLSLFDDEAWMEKGTESWSIFMVPYLLIPGHGLFSYFGMPVLIAVYLNRQPYKVPIVS